MDVTVWNVLHDGLLVAAEGTLPGDLRLSVNIQYLCDHLPTASRCLAVVLAGCERFEYRPYDGPPVTDPAAVAALGLELLSGAREDGTVVVACAGGGPGGGGELRTQYRSCTVATAEGRPLPRDVLELAADRYWAMWEHRHAEPSCVLSGIDSVPGRRG